MNWREMDSAPADGTHVRVLVVDPGRRELPWYVYFSHGRWRYHTTGAPLHGWHTPVAWTDEPRLAKQRDDFDQELRRARGSKWLPSLGLALLPDVPA